MNLTTYRAIYILSWDLKPHYRCVDVRDDVGTIGHQDCYGVHGGVDFVAHHTLHSTRTWGRKRR